MLEPLDAGKLRALTADEASEESSDLELAKSFFAKGGLAEGMKSLLEVFNLGIPSICRDKKNPRNWHIRFRVCYPCCTSSMTDFWRRNPPSTPFLSNPVKAT